MGQKRPSETCEEMRDLIFPYLKGDVTTALSRKIEDHLQGCSRCRRELRLLKELQRLEIVSSQGAVDPESFISSLNCQTVESPSAVPTVKYVLNEIEGVCTDRTLDPEIAKKQILNIIHSFLVKTRSFLQSRSRIKAGREWVKLEKRRAVLLQQILRHPCAEIIRSVIKLQAQAYVSRGLIFQLQGDTLNAESSLSLSVVLHWALNTSDDNQTQRFLGELKYYEGDLDAAECLFAESLNDPRLDSHEQAVLLRNLGNVEYSRGNLANCSSYLEQAMTVSLTLDEPDYAARDLMNLSVIDFSRGALIPAAKRCREALDRLNGCLNVHLKAQLHANLGTFLAAQGLSAESTRHWQKALEFFQKGYFVKDAVQVMRNIALAAYENGNLDYAATTLKTAKNERFDEDSLTCQIVLLLGRIYRINGLNTEALSLISQAETIAEHLQETLLLDAIHLEFAFIALAQNRLHDLAAQIVRTSAVKKAKPAQIPSVFDLENEAQLVEVFFALKNPRDASRNLQRLKRMIKIHKKRTTNPISRENNASGESWETIIQRLQTMIRNI